MFKRKLRKGLTFLLTATMVMWGISAFSVATLLPIPAQAAAGDLVMSVDGDGAVYVVLADGESICRLVSEGHYDMWAQYKAKGVGRWQDISKVDISTYTDSGLCSLRVGSLVRTQANPEVFVIQSSNTKRGFDAWETFVNLGYGSGGVYFVTDDVLNKYTTGDKIISSTTSPEIREGQLVKYASSATVYYVAKEGETLVKREVTNETAYFSNFGINWNLVVTIPATETYTASTSSITGADTSINRPAATPTPTEPVVTEELTVTLASTTPASATVPQASMGVPFTRILLTGDASITKIVVTRKGLGTRATFDGVALYEGNTKLTLSRTITSDDTATFNLTTPITVVGDTPRTITIAGDIASGATAGDQNYFQITSAADITASGATVAGTFPIAGNVMSIASVSVGQLKVEMETTADATINVGETNKEIGRFKLTAQTTAGATSSEDITVKALRLRQIGSAQLTDLDAIKVYQDSTELTGVTISTSSDYITIDNLNKDITKGNFLRLVIKVSVLSGGGQTVQLQVEEPSDLTTLGKTYGSGVYVHNGTTTWAVVDGTAITLQAGELSLAMSSGSKSITTREDNVDAGTLTITAAEESTISRLYGLIDGVDQFQATTGASIMDNSIESIRLQKADGSITYDATAGTDDNDDNYEFHFANVVVPKGASEWKILFNTVDSVTVATNTYQVALNASISAPDATHDGESLGDFSAKNAQNKSITDIKPGAVITGPVITLSAASLTVVQIGKDNTTIVGGTKGVVAIEFQISAGTADDVTITQMAFQNAGGTTATGSTEMSNFALYQDGVTDALQSGVSPSSSLATFTVTFGEIKSGEGLKIAKGTSVKLTVKFDANSPSAITDGHLLILKAAATDYGITARDSAGNNLASINDGDDTTATNVGRTVTFADDGQLTITKEDVLTNAQVLGGTTGVDTLKLKFVADYESVNLTYLVLDCANASGDSISAVHLYDADGNKIVSATYSPATCTAYFGNGSDAFYQVDKDAGAILTVKVDFQAVGSGADAYTADSGDIVQWTLDHGDNDVTAVKAKGASSSADISLSATYALSEILIGGDLDITGNSYIVKRTLISSITGANSSTDMGTTLLNGATVKLFAFTITAAADSSGHNYNDAVDLTKLLITVAPGGDFATNTLSSAVIYALDKPADTVSATVATGTLTFSDTSSLGNILPGSSKTFVVRGILPTGLTITTADTLQLKIADLGDSTTPTAVDFSDGHVIWSDLNSGTANNTDWVGYSGIEVTDIVGPVFMGPQQ